MIAQANGKYAPKTISGAGTLAADGTLTVTQTAAPAVEETLEVDSIKIGPSIEGGENRQLKISKFGGPNTVVVRDSIGNLNAERLGGKTVSQIISSSVQGPKKEYTVGTQTRTEQTHPNKRTEVLVSGTDGTGPNPATEFTVAHNLGFIPNAEVYKVTSSAVIPIEAEVVNGVNSTTVKFTQSIGSIPSATDIKLVLG